jgi:hydrophobic/amphiphilic exporter-1 (mainly G- bacteria), HAE1 family
MAEFFIRRPIVAMVISIVTCIVGLVSLSRLPIAEYPNVSPTLIQVTSSYRGAAAEAVMESVATPIESKVNGVDKLLYMQSYNANDGKMTLNVTFDVGTDVDIMQVNTSNRVSQAQAQLPDAVKREGVVVNRSSPDILLAIGLSSPKGTYDGVFLGNYADINLVDQIKRVRGVGDVKNFTAQDYSMRIWLDPEKLASLGITPTDIANAIKEQNAQAPAGRIGAVQRARPGTAERPLRVRGNHRACQCGQPAGEDQGCSARGARSADLRPPRSTRQGSCWRARRLSCARRERVADRERSEGHP